MGEKVGPISFDQLEFDRYNPRLVQHHDLPNASNEDILTALVEEADIGELVLSILENEYLDIEPLIVTQKDVTEPGKYRVLEGNRRLGAIQLISQPALAKKLKIRIDEPVSEDVLKSIQHFEVFEVDDELEARSFIGFKHVNGPHRWDSYAKAKFITDWYIREKDQGLSIENIAKKLGDKNQTVRNLISGMLVLNQAEENELFNIDDRTKPGPFGFSHLYTALTRKEYREFLGLEKNWNDLPLIAPVHVEKENALKEVLQFIYGSKSNKINSVIKSQNPDLKHLGEILVNPVACSMLRKSNELKIALEQIREPAEVFRDALINAQVATQEALGKLSKFSNQDGYLLEVADQVQSNANIIFSTIKRKVEK